MPTVINGLPAHVLLIHVIVVLAPIAALFLVLMAAWPAAHRRIGVYGPITALIVLVFTPITTHAGEWYRDYITKQAGGKTPSAIAKHADLGDTFLWFAIGLFLVSAAVWYLGRTYEFGVIGRSQQRTPGDDASGSTGGTTTLTRTRPATKQMLSTAVSVAILVVSVAMAVAAVWQLYRIGDSGAKAVYGGNL